MTLDSLVGGGFNMTVVVVIVIACVLLLKANYYSSGANDIYEQDKAKYEAKIAGQKQSQPQQPQAQANTDAQAVVAETTTTTTTTSTTRKMGDWNNLSTESIKEDSRVAYSDPLPEQGNLGEPTTEATSEPTSTEPTSTSSVD